MTAKLCQDKTGQSFKNLFKGKEVGEEKTEKKRRLCSSQLRVWHPDEGCWKSLQVVYTPILNLGFDWSGPSVLRTFHHSLCSCEFQV